MQSLVETIVPLLINMSVLYSQPATITIFVQEFARVIIYLYSRYICLSVRLVSLRPGSSLFRNRSTLQQSESNASSLPKLTTAGSSARSPMPKGVTPGRAAPNRRLAADSCASARPPCGCGDPGLTGSAPVVVEAAGNHRHRSVAAETVDSRRGPGGSTSGYEHSGRRDRRA